MDVKAYISSGIIERYVLQEVSPQELQEVSCLSHIYPEIKNEIETLQASLEQMIQKGAVDPPTELKQAILNRIKNESQIQNKPMQIVPNETSGVPNKTAGILKLGLAACIVGLLGLGMLIYVQSDKIAVAENELSIQEENLAKAKDQIEKAKTEKNTSEETLAFLKDVETLKIRLNGTADYPEMKAVVYWNSAEEKTYLEINNLPAPPSSKQYQLWAIVDGIPTDMGVVPPSELAEFIAVKNIKSPAAFAITLEPFGGSKQPTLDQMYVVGNV